MSAPPLVANRTTINRQFSRPEGRTLTGVLWLQLILSTLGYLAITAVPLNEKVALALFHAFLIGFAILHFVWLLAQYRGDVLQPHFVLVCLIYLYTTASAQKALDDGSTYMGIAINDSIMRTYYANIILGTASMLIGAWSYVPRVRQPEIAALPVLTNTPEVNVRWKLLAYGLILGAPIADRVVANFLPIGIKSYHETAQAIRVEAIENPTEVLVTVLAGIPTQLLLCAGILFVLQDPRLFRKMCGAALVAGGILVPLLSGFRSTVVDKVFLMASIYHYRVRRVSLPQFAGLMVCGHLFLAFMSVARTSSDPVEMVQSVMEYFFSDSGDTLGLSTKDSSELWSAQNLMVMIHFIDSGQVDYSYGTTIISELGCFVPRALWPGRPTPAGEVFADLITPGATSMGIGYGAFLMQEGYWAGGLIGVCVTMFVFGRCVQWAYCTFRNQFDSDLGSCMYGCFLPVIAQGIRGGVVLQVKVVAMALIPFILFMLLPPRDPAIQKRRVLSRRSTTR